MNENATMQFHEDADGARGFEFAKNGKFVSYLTLSQAEDILLKALLALERTQPEPAPQSEALDVDALWAAHAHWDGTKSLYMMNLAKFREAMRGRQDEERRLRRQLEDEELAFTHANDVVGKLQDQLEHPQPQPTPHSEALAIPDFDDRYNAGYMDAMNVCGERIARAEQEARTLREKLALLADPSAVHINILRGGGAASGHRR